MKNEFKKRINKFNYILPISFFFIIKGSYLFFILLIICFLISFMNGIKMSKKNHINILGFIFLIFLFFLFIKLEMILK